ncbi:hypothetical protein KORDIASMS9_03239 [Kordia sp. SMS9]|uniref:T9SS type A sorting domain-containing protein n=1 Tax=Kordia sp. SMS9 TaxID=2282170 RepID=UPI000E0DA87F|nr:T9SS type A sorting domain-containing protein [Kordia sp. SMS9]AXG70984.1 hypothetical protein KORDIASMS9_03239 [Kordia sp. SMS9]
MKKYYLLLTFLIGVCSLYSQNLDSYNFVKTTISGFDLWSYAMTTDNAGNIYATGKTESLDTDYEEIVVIKYLPNGAIDSSFGTDGVFSYDFGSMLYQRGNDITVATNGKILITGYASVSYTHQNLFVMRLNQNGTLDTSFNTDGVFTIDNGYKNNAHKIVIANGGKIFIGGTIATSTTSQLAMLKLNDNGTYDTTFNLDGISATDIGNNSDNNYIKDMDILPDGKIMTLAATGYSILLVRFTNNGELDTTFGAGDGIYEYSPGNINYEYYASEFHINTDGTIFILATKDCVGCNPGSGSNVSRWVFKIDTNGAFDNTFSGNGEYYIDNFLSPRVAFAITDAQEIYIAVKRYDFELRKLTSSGTLDTSFHSDGIWNTTTVDHRKMYPLEMSLDSSGELMILGKFFYPGFLDNSFIFYNGPTQNNVVLSVEEAQLDGGFALYPNPTKDVFYVKNDNINSPIAIEVYNSLGMQLFTKKLSHIDNSISLQGYASGVYYVKFSGTNTTQTILKN